MQTIANIVEAVEVSRRNHLKEKCAIQLDTAIKTGNTLNATIFVATIFSLGLKDSVGIVNEIRDNNKSIIDLFF